MACTTTCGRMRWAVDRAVRGGQQAMPDRGANRTVDVDVREAFGTRDAPSPAGFCMCRSASQTYSCVCRYPFGRQHGGVWGHADAKPSRASVAPVGTVVTRASSFVFNSCNCSPL